MMTMRAPACLRSRLRVAILVLVVSAAASIGAASADSRLEYAFHYEYSDWDGEWSRALGPGWGGEFALRDSGGMWAPGLAVHFGSHDMPAPYSEATWSNISLHATLGLRAWRERRLQPFAELRAGWIRLRPETELFLEDPQIELELGQNPFEAHDGAQFSLLTGASARLGWSMAVELSASLSAVWTQEADLAPVGGDPVDRGSSWGLRLGLVWGP